MKSTTRAISAAVTPISRVISAAGASGWRIRRRLVKPFCARGVRQKRAGHACSSSSPARRRHSRSVRDDTAAMSDDDLFEVEELQRVAEWRLRKVDADASDGKSADA